MYHEWDFNLQVQINGLGVPPGIESVTTAAAAAASTTGDEAVDKAVDAESESTTIDKEVAKEKKQHTSDYRKLTAKVVGALQGDARTVAQELANDKLWSTDYPPPGLTHLQKTMHDFCFPFRYQQIMVGHSVIIFIRDL